MNMKIRLTKDVTFKDWNGDIVKAYKAGDILEASADGGHYWVTALGGIYKSEAELIEGT